MLFRSLRRPPAQRSLIPAAVPAVVQPLREEEDDEPMVQIELKESGVRGQESERPELDPYLWLVALDPGPARSDDPFACAGVFDQGGEDARILRRTAGSRGSGAVVATMSLVLVGMVLPALLCSEKSGREEEKQTEWPEDGHRR